MPRSAAIRAAVCGWSPVIISTRTPAARASAMAARGLRPRRVDDPDHPEVDELALDRLVLRGLLVRPAAAGRRRRASAARGRRAARRSARISLRRRVRQRPHLAADPLLGAAGEQHVRCALGDDGEPELASCVGLERAHQLALGGERHLADALEPRAARLGQPLDLRLGDQERRLGGVALDRPLAALLAQHGVVRQAAGREHRVGPRRAGPGRRAAARRRAARPRAGSRCR